jgi:uncharacterized OsmC-like protein
MYAKKHAIPLADASVVVSLNRDTAEGPTFEYRIELHGSLSDVQRSRLLASVENCPVRATLSKNLRFMPAAGKETENPC